ncbi:RagB/SusD family nutrient uptake outer membrane protein [Pedobacter ginsengisoli]|uniref:RagB/SusD family nutrient uptake outer membrane protein n=1 Tax=Pedobacter ginsengisoli TaxID=363852 RepID=A0A2D1U3R6_9SPHI|nr:RagB/SusD family nutrient uptake outer membrane protein [Pedobacter ginsengisoli]ATP56259.1 RagB/SusD family nutrient uptake outer membrane protein [Pedobacter ginsengisoli]
MKSKIKTIAILKLIVLLFCTSCSKFVEVDPPITSTNGDNVFNEDGSAMAVMTGLYTNMSQMDVSNLTGRLTNVFFTTGMTGDELELRDKSNSRYGLYYFNNISPIESTWGNIYNMIFIANSAIEKLPTGTLLTPSVRNQALGEAKFMRALCYFYLVNLYGDIPLALTTDYKVNDLLPRSSSDIVYRQIISDLKDAQDLLNENYMDKDGVSRSLERVRPCKSAATALLARVYLYIGSYNDALLQSSNVIGNSETYELVNLDEVFLKNNREAIWQLQPVGVNALKTKNTREGQLLKILPENNEPLVFLSPTLVDSFDDKDQRKINWINTVTTLNGSKYAYAYKYKIGFEDSDTKEYSTVFRLGEQYLIRAEAKIQLGDIDQGISDLNKIRKRATDLSVSVSAQLSQLPFGLSKIEALLAVEEERKNELFTEWGHRWLDLKRTGRADAVLGVKPGWQTTDQLFPLPGNDVRNNPNLKGHQNPGYN